MPRVKSNKENKSNHYINNDMLVEELRKSKELGKPTLELVDMFKKLSRKISGSFIYDNEEDRIDCVMFSLTVLLEKWDKYDLTKDTNAFSYYTQIALNGLRAGWNQLNSKKSKTVSLDAIFEEPV